VPTSLKVFFFQDSPVEGQGPKWLSSFVAVEHGVGGSSLLLTKRTVSAFGDRSGAGASKSEHAESVPNFTSTVAASAGRASTDR